MDKDIKKSYTYTVLLLLLIYIIVGILFYKKFKWTSIIFLTLFTFYLFFIGIIYLSFFELIDENGYYKKDSNKNTEKDCTNSDNYKGNECGIWDKDKNLCRYGNLDSNKNCRPISVPYVFVYSIFGLAIVNIIALFFMIRS